MNAVTFLVKPASGLCDMRCRYCFYEDVTENRAVKSRGMMSRDTARVLIEKGLAYAGPGGTAHFLFQGGEPTLAGLDFYRDFVTMAENACPAGTHVSYAIQTNGLSVDKNWAAFFKAHDFLVGLSLDGTRTLPDRHRRDAAGNGTWDRAVKALGLLDEAGTETNLLAVVTGPMAAAPSQVWKSLTALGDHPLQFIPCLDPLEAERGGESWSLTPEAYGKFLKGLFDCWYQDLTRGRYVSVRLFDDLLRLLAGMPPSSCAAAGVCGGYLAAEADGGLYPCDFYVLDEYYLGNIHDVSPADALASPVMAAFLSEGAKRPAGCDTCRYYPLCRGGCRRDRFAGPAGPENYWCPSMKALLDHALPRLQAAARMLFR